MPELPEVDVMTRKLRHWALGSIIHDVKVLRQNGRYLPDSELELVRDGYINNIWRVGKVIVFELTHPVAISVRGFKPPIPKDGPGIVFLTCHNAMSGYWDCKEEPWTFDYVEGARESSEKDVRVEINTGTLTLRFHDTRLFGSIRAHDIRQSLPLPLGPEALFTENSPAVARQITPEELCAIGRGRHGRHPIKHILMDQNLVAGIGNIYSAEALFRAGIDPGRSGNTLTDGDFYRLFECTRNVLTKAIECNLDYKKYLKVYRQPNCMFCSQKIQRVDLKGRSTYFCSSCQD